MKSYLLNYFLSFNSLKGLIRPLFSNVWSVMWNKPNRLAPLYVTWLITNRCNCRCRHCSNRYDSLWANKSDMSKELTAPQAEKVAQDIGRSKIWGVTISGGEPLMREDIFKIIKILKHYDKVVNLSTNGEFLKDHAEKLISLGVDTVSVSFDSVDAKTHDYLRSNEGLFKKAEAGIEELKRLRKGKLPKIKVRCTISKKNFNDMEEYIKFWLPKVDNIVFQPIQDSFIHQVQDKELLFSQKDYDELKRKLDNLIKKYKFLDNIYYRYMLDYIFAPQKLLAEKKFRCFFRSNFNLCIDAYGDVRPCHGIRTQTIGNVKDEKIIDLWKKQETFRYQQALRAKNCNCICWEDGTFINLYLVRFFNFTEKLLFFRSFPEDGFKTKKEIESEPKRFSNLKN